MVDRRTFGSQRSDNTKYICRNADEKKGNSGGQTAAYTYPAGLGPVLMNGCFGTGYKNGDPCFQAKIPRTGCPNLIDGATYLGVGFDGRGVYSAESRKKSIIQRSCDNLQTYGENEVPDSMTVQGIYDTNVESYTFSSTEEYRQYLAEKSAVTSANAMFQEEINKASGHIAKSGAFGLVWSAGGGLASQRGEFSQSSSFRASSSASAQLSEQHTQTFMAMLEMNIFRYEIFMDDVTPDQLNVGFLRDFISLPESYFSIGAEMIFQNFYLRWGTHYIKSAKFGGQLKLMKTKQASKSLSISEFATRAESDWKKTFSTFTALSTQTKSKSWWHEHETKTDFQQTSGEAAANSESEANRQQENQASSQEYSNEVLEVQGGDQQIASAITEMYTTALTTELKDWLDSIDEYPKPFFFVLRLVSDVLNIPFDSLFPAGEVDFGCFGKKNLRKETGTGRKYYTQKATELGGSDEAKNGTATVTVSEIRYCNFADRKAFEDSMTKKRLSLERAVTVYLEEGRVLTSDFLLPAGEAGCETAMLAFLQGNNTGVPKWEDMIGGKGFTVVFDMPDTVGDVPCSLYWSNAHRFDPTDGGKCIHFTAASEGDIFVVFASIPQNHETWVYIQISPEGVALYKALKLHATQLDDDSGGLGSATLYQSYFVCVTEDLEKNSTVIQYGKTPDNEERPHVWFSIKFKELASLRYYSFGSGEYPVKVMGLSLLDIPARDFIICRRGTVKIDGFCQQTCHSECEGCRTSGSNSPNNCIACKHLKVPRHDSKGNIVGFKCVAQCPQHMRIVDATKSCTCIKGLKTKGSNGALECQKMCPLTHFDSNDVCRETCSAYESGVEKFTATVTASGVDLKRLSSIAGVITQGRADANQWVTSYKLSFSSDGAVWDTYSEKGKEKV
uniref:MACPF domain-containing protein n=1 Tax=Branchiostoma floridae TaxID=7739 RepID=C3YVS5_BRAFL|eukprot:XP_002599597.1 hypothetical protein BRAFLDRAFT_77695 [Branchiostoma floridae]